MRHFEQEVEMPNQNQKTNPLAELRSAIAQASPDEKRELARELGLAPAVGAPRPRQRRMETNETVRELSRISGGASSAGTVGPAPAPWIVDLGGGHIKDDEGSELPGEDAWKDNWAVEMMRDRWMNGQPALPNSEAYLRERQSQGYYESTIDGKGMAQIEELAAASFGKE